jgi:hypothetical protein
VSRSPGAFAAYAALRRGTAFLRANAVGRGTIALPIIVGNALAELDRLLHVLIVQIARDRRVSLFTCPRSNAERLAMLCGAHADGNRLRALLRSTTCLRRHDGRAQHADRRACGFMTVGWSKPNSISLRQVAIGSSIIPSADQMKEVCAFYDRLAYRLIEGFQDVDPRHGLARLAA